MKVLNPQKIALGAIAVMALGFGANHANAQATANIGSTFVTEPGLQATAGTDLDFGSWVVNLNGGDTPTITQAAPTTGNPPAAGTVAGVVDPNTIVQNTVAPATAGTVDLDSPISGDVRVRASISAFTNADVVLQDITVSDAGSNVDAAVTAAFGATVVEVVTGGTTETINFGGELLLGDDSGSVPDDTTFNDASIQVEFAY